MEYLYFREVDFFNLKTYDLHGHWDEPMAAVHHSPLTHADSPINIVRPRHLSLFINMHVNMHNYIYNRRITVSYLIKSDMIKRNAKSQVGKQYTLKFRTALKWAMCGYLEYPKTVT